MDGRRVRVHTGPMTWRIAAQRTWRVLLLVLVARVLLLGVPALAAAGPGNAFPAARAAAPLPAHPAITAPGWAAGALAPPGGWIDLTTRAAAPLGTRVWMLYDEHNLYVAFRCEQRGTPITATQSTNGIGFGSDDFAGVGIDTSGNGSLGYFFETTPRGVRYQQAEENVRYRPQWTAAAAVSDGGWSAVLIIPLDALRIHAGSPQNWRINFIRSIAATADHYTFAYDGLMQDGPVGEGWPTYGNLRFWPSWTGIRVTGVKGSARPKPRAEVYALESFGRDRNLFQQANGAFAPQQVRVTGIDVSYPLTHTINFVGTLNPDFSNVEIDQQTIAPQEFGRFLQEYRPFFAQGASFLNPNPNPFGPDEIFYSPSVGPFDRGEKVEGTYGLQSFGLLNFRGYDVTTGNTFDDTAFGFAHALPDRTFQYWADGVFAHHSLFGDDSTAEAGVKGRNLRNGFVWSFDTAVEHGSWVPQGTAQSSYGFVDVHKPYYEVNLEYADLSPNYDPIDGFTANSDIRGFTLFVNTTGSLKWMKNFNVFATADRYFDRSGAVHQADADVSIQATFKNGFSLDGIGPQIGELRSYAAAPPASGQTCDSPELPRTYFTGYPQYLCGRTDTYNLFAIPVGYGDGTSRPIDASVSFGNFGYQNYLHLYSLSTSRPLGRYLTLGAEFAGSVERNTVTGALDSQWLRRLTLGAELGPDENLTVSLRGINGAGGFAIPGVNLAAAYHRRFRNGNELYLNFGTPAAPYTLDRTIFKYVFHFGGDPGT